jgi:hypothetical protein
MIISYLERVTRLFLPVHAHTVIISQPTSNHIMKILKLRKPILPIRHLSMLISFLLTSLRIFYLAGFELPLYRGLYVPIHSFVASHIMSFLGHTLYMSTSILGTNLKANMSLSGILLFLQQCNRCCYICKSLMIDLPDIRKLGKF